MTSVVNTMIWAIVVLVLAFRMERLANRLMSVKFPSQIDAPSEPIPDDLEAFALMESELYAQESVREVIRNRYTDLKDWNLVRRAVGIGTIDK